MMTDLIHQCDVVLEKVKSFSEDELYLGTPILDDRLEVFEKQIGFEFPFEFKYILKKHNGISLNGTEIFGIDAALRRSSLDQIYKLEHEEAGNPMPAESLPFSPDGYGNHYCLNLAELSDGICPVVFWQHDFLYENITQVETCNSSLTDWINEVMIDWALDDDNQAR